MSKSTEKRKEFIKWRGMGDSYDTIAGKIGVTKKTLIAWSRKFAVEIAEAKGKALDSVIEEYDLAKSGRLKIVAKDMLRIDAELAKRDLASIPTTVLMRMKLMALDVAGKILDATKIEHSGSIEVKDNAWEQIIKQCGYDDLGSFTIDEMLSEIENREKILDGRDEIRVKMGLGPGRDMVKKIGKTNKK